MKRILIVAAHPDDEILGCGGYILNQLKFKHQIFVLFISDGVSARFPKSKIHTDSVKKLIIKRKNMANKCSNFLKFKIVDFLDYENLRMQNIDLLDLVKNINSIINRLNPDEVLCNHPGDLNTDHRVTFEATYTALRPFTTTKKYFRFMTYEVVSSTNWSHRYIGSSFKPNFYLDISENINVKKKALDFYKDEMRKYPHTRSWKSILSFHHTRGAEVGLEYAEAYEIIKQISK